ncbi:helix-turn-helix transcriptional regulator [Gordonia sp. SMJS1]|uniref:helix-turn-helix domain-containing protein n=1 Tax=Gordonia sp. SMJS1 TaxID=3039400 RepID=UPI0032AF680C
MTADLTELISAIGPRLRTLRLARALTLTAVAEESGLSISALSRVETGKRQPTLERPAPPREGLSGLARSTRRRTAHG